MQNQNDNDNIGVNFNDKMEHRTAKDMKIESKKSLIEV